MKRVLCIVGGMNAGGAETFLMKIYRELNRDLYQMDFAVAIKEEGFYDKEIKKMGGRIFHITPKSEGFVRNFISIKELVKSEKYEYVLRTSQHSLSALELFAARIGGARITVFRSSNTSTTSKSKKDLFLHNLFKFMPKIFANVKIAPSTEAGIYMFGKKNKRVEILHNGVDWDTFSYDSEIREIIRREFSIEDRFVLGHVGRFSEQKNHRFLIEVFKEISLIREDAILLLVGKGELEEEIKERVHNYGLDKKVIFTGVRTDVNKILNAMDYFVFPSFYEGMPNTVIEAQANGLKCLVSDKITPEADITGLVHYMSIDSDAKKWAEKILSENDCKHINTKNEFIKNKYDIESVVQEFIRILEL